MKKKDLVTERSYFSRKQRTIQSIIDIGLLWVIGTAIYALLTIIFL